MDSRKVSSLMITLLLIISGTVLSVGSVAGEEKPETVTFGVQMDISAALHSLADGELDLFMHPLRPQIYDEMDPEVKNEIGVWESSDGYNNWFVNPAREGPGTGEMQDAMDEGWIDDPDEVRYEANNADGEWEFNPFAVQDVRYSLQHLTDRQGHIEDIRDGFGEPRYIWEKTGTGPYVEHFEDMIEGGTRDSEDGTFGMTPHGDQEWARDFAFDALEDIAEDDDALMGDLQHNGDTWEYQGPDADDYEAVEVTLAIREEDWRLDQGARFADAIEEYLDFEADEWVASRATLSPQVFYASPEPWDNLPFHIYTGDWRASRPEYYPHESLREFYTPSHGWTFSGEHVSEGRWHYGMTEEGQELNDLTYPLYAGRIETEEEYWLHVMETVELAVQESVRVFTTTETNLFTYNSESVDEAITNVITGWDRIFLPRTIQTDKDHLDIDQFMAPGLPFPSPWNRYTEGRTPQRRKEGWVLGRQTHYHPESGLPVPLKSSWEVETDYQYEGEELVKNIEIPESAMEYDPHNGTWEQVEDYYDEVPDAATSATISISEGRWHDDTELGLHTIVEHYGMIKNVVYRNRDYGEEDDYYYASYSSEEKDWWENVKAIEFHPEEDAYTIYGDYTFPDEDLIGQYYTIEPRTSPAVYEAIKQEVYETGYSIHEDTTLGWDAGEAEILVQLIGVTQIQDYYKPTMEYLIDEGFVPTQVNVSNEVLPDELTFTEEEYADELQAAVDFAEDHDNLFISYGPYYFEDRIPEIREKELAIFDGYDEFESKVSDEFEEIELFDLQAPEEAVIGEDLEISARGHIQRLYPKEETLPISEDEDLEVEEARLYRNEQLVRETEDISRDVGEENTLFEGVIETEGLEPDEYRLEMGISLENQPDESTIGQAIQIRGLQLQVDVLGQSELDIDPERDFYELGDEVLIEAIPDEDWYFHEWTGDYEGTEQEITIEMDQDKEITAHILEEAHFDIEIVDYDQEVYEEDQVIIDYTVTNAGHEEATQDIEFYVDGILTETEEDITLGARSAYQGEFEWFGDKVGEYELKLASEDSSDTVTIAVEEEVIHYDLTLDIEGEGTTEPEEGTHTYNEGEEVTIEATPEEGWYFDEWTGDHEGTEEQINLTIDEDKELIANFEEVIEEYDLTFILQNEDGEWLEGVEITVDEEMLETDEEGEVVFEDMDPGTYGYTVEKEGYETVENEITIEDERKIEEITLEEASDEALWFLIALLGLSWMLPLALSQMKKWR